MRYFNNSINILTRNIKRPHTVHYTRVHIFKILYMHWGAVYMYADPFN